jgi:aryl-alcohol dehydrogenase-like predicted oxidoreductase
MSSRSIPTLSFGRTGHISTRTIFGGAALGAVSQGVADATLEVLLEFGVNHIDVAASYGEAEVRVGRWMGEHRSRFFLATKTGQRSYREARDEIHRSLERLRVDQVDLIQLHNLVDPIEWDQALSPDGALDACIEARDEKLVRFIGVTGHGTAIPAMHLRSLERFDFDSVLAPYSYVMMQDDHYARQFEAMAAVCSERGIAIQTMKTIALRPWMGREHEGGPWYEPLQSQEDIEAAVHWAMYRPNVFLNTVADTRLLPRVLDAASRFSSSEPVEPLTDHLAAIGLVPLFV